MFDMLRPVLGRIAGALAAGILTWVGARLGIEFSADDHAAVAGVIVAAMFLGYSLVHRAVAAKLNPVDAAKPSVAATTKESVAATEEIREEVREEIRELQP